MDDKRYLQHLISEGEHQQQDFKYRVSDAYKLAKSVSAFANTDGGRLLIGVRDDGHMSGVRSEEEIYMMHQAAYRYCRPEASIKFDTYHVEGVPLSLPPFPLQTNALSMPSMKTGSSAPTSALPMRTSLPHPFIWPSGESHRTHKAP